MVRVRKRDILEIPPQLLSGWMDTRGEPRYRCDQVLGWLYRRFASSFEEMTNLPPPIRSELQREFLLGGVKCIAKQGTAEDGVQKFLLELSDGEVIESVSMRDEDRLTFCISCQAGCALGCRFCATGRVGFARNLTTGEILAQVVTLARESRGLRNVVFMGMGEPLLNLEALLPALDALTDPGRLAVGARRITVSTAGIPDGIARLAAHTARPNLALSLNSPFDRQRSHLMPVNERYPLSQVIPACKQYIRTTGRKLALEYVLIDGINDSRSAAQAVADVAAELGAYVNLIPLNPVESCPYRPPKRAMVYRFAVALKDRGISVSQRFRRGQTIQAGCGQLKGSHRER